MLKADLHTHSFCSDGTSSPEEVAYGAWKAGVKIFALADHDTTEGVLRTKVESEKHGMDWVSAVEISTREHDHLHFLGYNVDINNAGFQSFLKQNGRRIAMPFSGLQCACPFYVISAKLDSLAFFS